MSTIGFKAFYRACSDSIVADFIAQVHNDRQYYSLVLLDTTSKYICIYIPAYITRLVFIGINIVLTILFINNL